MLHYNKTRENTKLNLPHLAAIPPLSIALWECFVWLLAFELAAVADSCCLLKAHS